MSTEFSKSLLKSAATDTALPNAKARALAHVEHAMQMAPTASTVAAATSMTTAKFGLAMLAAASLGGALGAGGGYAVGQSSRPAAPSKVENVQLPTSNMPTANTGTPVLASQPLAPSDHASATAMSGQPSTAADACSSLAVEPSNKCSVKGGRTVTFAVKNDCSIEPLDVFWVDLSCREVYRGILRPSETLWQDSWEGHVFRLRNRTTHQLVKEIAPTAIDGAPDRAKVWKGPPTDIPTLTVGDDNRPIAEAPPAECAHGGGRAAVYHFQNDRKNEPIVVSWVDGDCKETHATEIDPGKKYDLHASEGHAFRVRDAAGALLMDVPPTSLDTSTYLSVP